MHLVIQPWLTDEHWNNHPTYSKAKKQGDCGLDIPMQRSITVPENSLSFSIQLDISTEPTHAFMLVPRSSITKTPLRLANSIGIIDRGYRGQLLAKVDNLTDEPFTLDIGKCYFQIVAFDGILPSWKIGKPSETIRGSGGFGSTTK